MKQATTRIQPPDAAGIHAAIELLQAGEVVALPTETVYGLAGNALREEALTKIFRTKERPVFDPLIVHVPFEMDELQSEDRGKIWLQRLDALDLIDTSQIPEKVLSRLMDLFKAFWPGPLTVVLPKTSKVPDLATSGLPSVALRMPNHPVFQSVLRGCGFPLAAPSANRFGRISPTTARNVEQELGNRIQLILDGGACEIGVESTIIKLSEDGVFDLMRPGKITDMDIAKVIRDIPRRREVSITNIEGGAESVPTPMEAPGTLASHYAPTKKLYMMPKPWARLNADELYRARILFENKSKVEILCLSPLKPDLLIILEQAFKKKLAVRNFSQTGELEDVAHHLFRTMREADASPSEVLLVEPPVKIEGFGHAIYDRLYRASQHTLLIKT
jgi:L-threonylcarbamoyladenylate synthase